MTRTCQSHLRHLLQVSCRSQWIVVHGHQIIGEHEVFQAPCDLSVFHFFRHKKTTNISGTYPYTTFHLSLFGNGWHIWSYDIYIIYHPISRLENVGTAPTFGILVSSTETSWIPPVTALEGKEWSTCWMHWRATIPCWRWTARSGYIYNYGKCLGFARTRNDDGRRIIIIIINIIKPLLTIFNECRILTRVSFCWDVLWCVWGLRWSSKVTGWVAASQCVHVFCESLFPQTLIDHLR